MVKENEKPSEKTDSSQSSHRSKGHYHIERALCILASSLGVHLVPKQGATHNSPSRPKPPSLPFKKDLTKEGIEPNPGPPKKHKQASKKQNKPSNKPQSKKGSLGRSALRAAGSALGGMVGFPEVGRKASDWLSDIIGMGDYTVHNNSILKESDGVPEFKVDSEGTHRIRHRELITDVQSSQSFRSTNWNINPTNKALFPWLSKIAGNFDQYEFKGLLFAYRERSAMALNSVNTALGTVILSTQYDVSKPPFQNKQEMEAYEFTTADEPSKNMLHPVECNPHMDILNSRYVRPALVPANLSVSVQNNLTDLGTFHCATVGMQADDSNIGELWVTYDVLLMKPRLAPNPAVIMHATNRNAAGTLDTGDWLTGMSLMTDSTAYPDPGFPRLLLPARIDFSSVGPGRSFLILVTSTGSTGAAFPHQWGLQRLFSVNYFFIDADAGTPTVGASQVQQSVSAFVVKTQDDNFYEQAYVKFDSAHIDSSPDPWYTDVTVIEIPTPPAQPTPVVQSLAAQFAAMRMALLAPVMRPASTTEQKQDISDSVYIPRSILNQYKRLPID